MKSDRRFARQNIAIAAMSAAVCCLIFWFLQPTRAEALANPITGGKSRGMVVTKTAQRIVATGQKCNLVVCNVNVQSRKFPVFTGMLDPDGGLFVAQNGIPICDNSVAGFVACPTMCFSFDAVPDSQYLITGTEADGGIPVRILEGTGCSTP